MSEQRFYFASVCGDEGLYDRQEEKCIISNIRSNVDLNMNWETIVSLLNEQQELIEELQVSDEMGWKRAERFEKKCPKELHNKKMYIKRLEYKVQKFKEENEQLKSVLRKECNIITDEDLLEYVKTNGVSLNE